MTFAKTSTRKTLCAAVIAASLLLTTFAGLRPAFAQASFVGDYDTSFAAPRGYFIDPEDPVPTIDDFSTYFVGGALLPNGSIIAGGRHVDNTPRGAMYLRKFTPTGAVDAAFGLNGVVRNVFYTGVAGQQLLYSNDIPQVLRVQPDGKILLAGQCNIHSPNEGVPWFGTDACLMRFNADGSADASFGNVQVFVGGGINGAGDQGQVYSFDVGPGRFMTQTGVIQAPGAPPPQRGTQGTFLDIDIQPDGKIVLVGETRNEFYNGLNPIGSQAAAFVMRLNANGTRDNSFGNFGISQMAATPTTAPNCYPNTGFQGVRVQADGRIIAVGYTNSAVNSNCFHGKRFTVTRWTAGGQLETVRTLDNDTAFNSRRERATTAFFTRDVGKLLVSGSYNCEAVLVRFNVADLSIDPSFGTNGIRGYAPGCPSDPSGFGSTLWVRAIQPDGRILGTDEGGPLPQGNVVRFNPDGTPDQSFGNEVMGGNAGNRGRLRVNVTQYNGALSPLNANAVLVRPNGRINLVGSSPLNASIGQYRAAVSQNTSTGAQNPIDDPQTFAFVHYYDFLNREADASGLAFWTNEITNCGSNAQCVDVKRVNVSQAFFLSIEFQQTGFLVARFYKETFTDSQQRPRGLPRMSEFLSDAQQIGQGVIVGQTGWEQKLEQNKQDFAQQWVQRPDFIALFPQTMTADAFVDKLFQNSEVMPTSAERAAAVAAYGAGGTVGRAAALRNVADSGSVFNRQFNPAFVLMQYIGYLRRNPNDAPDTDYTGYDFWLAKMNSVSLPGEDMRNASQAQARALRGEMVRAFLVSQEYRNRFGNP